MEHNASLPRKTSRQKKKNAQPNFIKKEEGKKREKKTSS